MLTFSSHQRESGEKFRFSICISKMKSLIDAGSLIEISNGKPNISTVNLEYQNKSERSVCALSVMSSSGGIGDQYLFKLNESSRSHRVGTTFIEITV